MVRQTRDGRFGEGLEGFWARRLRGVGAKLVLTSPSPTHTHAHTHTHRWKNEKFVIGKLSTKPRKINVVNTLTQQEYVLEVCTEETISEIQDRYIAYNGHAASYTWKRLTEDGEKFVAMDMDKTLEEVR